jgi:UDP-N-acetylmuramate dehydrogenase
VSLTISHHVDLTELNTFGVRTHCDAYVCVVDDASLPEAVALANEHAGERGVFVLGGGSNLLLTQPYRGCVLHVATRGRRVLDDDVVEAHAGENWDGFVRWTIAQGLCGLENLTLIPGTVGAAPIQNIGAYGVELKETFHSCDVISRSTGHTRRLSVGDCAFGYRDSVFKSVEGRDWIIRRVRFKLSRTPALRLQYGELRVELQSKGIDTPTAADVSAAVQAIRMRKLPDPVLLGNAGSFFKNPVVPTAQFEALKLKYAAMPHYADADGWMKIPAAWLIEQCGFKGVRRGDAGVHAHHALVLVNHGSATGREIWDLAQEIIAAVRQKFAISLSPEPIVL